MNGRVGLGDWMGWVRLVVLVWCVGGVIPCGVMGVVLFGTGDPSVNTEAPGGVLEGSGWQFQGRWGGFLGTAISPNHFVTASHVGGVVGDVFEMEGRGYVTTGMLDDPETDLRVWRVCGSLPRYAGLYTNSNERGMAFVVMGRGTERGGEVTTRMADGSVRTNGWVWGASTAVMRWGENVVAGVINGNGVSGASGLGELLQASFSGGLGTNACQLSNGDSGGGWFVKEGGEWRLAGVSYSAESLFNTSTNGDGFNAAIFDKRGLYERVGTGWRLVSAGLPVARPSSFYGTRVSTRAGWIREAMGVLGGGDGVEVEGAVSVAGPFVAVTNAVVDVGLRRVRVRAEGESGFYRLRSCEGVVIRSVVVEGGEVVMVYE